MYVAGTAGHVDHGKSTLIEALTGIDPDRLSVEKARGMTIELGFAWFELEDGREISIVDVPGHERFVKNMLMGAGGFDLALLVVAADEGVMPQTREHLAILDLLDVNQGIVVITKMDLADPELVELVELEIEEELEGTSLEGSPSVAVSAETGEGLDDLKRLIFEKVSAMKSKPDTGRPRLFIDRAFSMPGFGAVVTGTLDGGVLKSGDDVELLPSGLQARVRGLQSHKSELDAVLPGSRTAASLTGVSHASIRRGDALVKRGDFSTSAVFDASMRSIKNAPRSIKHNHQVTVYSGTWEEPATVRLLSGNRMARGESGYAQIKMGSARPIAVGDRFVLRDSNDTLGGGVALVVDAARHRRNDDRLIASLEVMSHGSEEERVLQALAVNPMKSISELSRLSNLSAERVEEVLAGKSAGEEIVKLASGASDFVYTTSDYWRDLSRNAVKELEEYHRRYPLRSGMPRQELRNRLEIPSSVFDGAARRLADDGVIVESDVAVKLLQHEVVLTDGQQAEADRYLDVLRSHRFSPPAGNSIDGELLGVLLARRDVVSAGPDVVFIADAYDEMRDRVVEFGKSNVEISINDVRELLGTSRKYSLALLEQMDRENITMRNGDMRTLR